MYTMENAYGGSVTALATFSDCCHVISGSNLGHVVVWDVPTCIPPGKVCAISNILISFQSVEFIKHDIYSTFCS